MVDYQDLQVGMSGTLWIQLKIEDKQVQELDHSQDIMDYEVPKNNDHTRICEVCNKGFSSGKALGGHMRIHVQAAKKLLSVGKKCKKLNPFGSRYYKKRILLQQDDHQDNYNNDIKNQLAPICSVCGKNFPSMKSLFGHMRSHPERAWRGIQPPAPNKNSCLSSASNEIAATTKSGDLSVPGWSVKAKRGRKGTIAEASSNSSLGSRSFSFDQEKDDEEHELHDAVGHLMLLANGNKTSADQELEITNSNSLTSKAETEQVDENKKKKKKIKLRRLGSVQDLVSPVSVHHDQKLVMDTPEKYKCNTCEKSFATHQALGGHRSSHNKFRMVIQNSVEDDVVTNVATSSIIGPVEEREEAAASTSKLLVDHNKNASASQVLGVQNRCQWGSPIDHQAGPSTSQLTSPGEVSHSIGRQILDFDLNELPPQEDEIAGGRDHQYFTFFPI
uniref:Tapetum-specific zinc finger protein 1 n=2 Tax=Petunia hybrida TaxID=4102 RepID=P93716_PETHY|nr:tapetum-specific zinc finger protein 1 [Petunia x hybrida]